MINLNIEEESLEEIKDILGVMFLNYGLTYEVVRLSQWIDKIVVITQKERQVTHKNIKHVIKDLVISK